MDDLPEIQVLYMETIQHTCKNDYDYQQLSVWTASVENKERWKEALIHQYFLVAEIENKIIGFGSLENGNHVDFIYVHKAFLRQGIANRLFQALESESKRLGNFSITADVSKTARPFFEKNGFKVVKENKNFISGVEVINYRMIKED